MLRRLLFAATLLLLCPSFAHAYSSFTGWCTVATSWMRVTNCTVTVFDAGTANLSTIYSDSAGTPLANPFTASSTTGKYQFFATNASYDVRLSGGTPTISPAYVQYSAVALLDITGSSVAFTGDIVPVTDNTSNVGTAAKTWAGGRFTNLTVDSATTTGTLASGAATFGGHITFPSDNTYDIGASSATRPRAGYFGTSVVVQNGNGYTVTDGTRIGRFGVAATKGEIGTATNHPFEIFTNNVNVWQWSTAGHLLALADNTYDIGASGATRPRTGYFGTSLVAPTGTFATSITTPLLTNASSTLTVQTTTADSIAFKTNGVLRWSIDSTGNLVGSKSGTQTISGTDASSPGVVAIRGGNVAAGGNPGGNVLITGGAAATPGVGAGGDVIITSGQSDGSTGGTVTIQTATGTGSLYGNINLTAKPGAGTAGNIDMTAALITLNNSFKLGAGTTLRKALAGSYTIDFAAPGANTTADSAAQTLTGVTTDGTWACSVSPDATVMATSGSFSVYVSAADQVKIRYHADVANANPANGVFQVVCIRQ